MDAAAREARVSAAFVAVAETLTSTFDAEDQLHALIHDCIEIVGMEAGGLALANSRGELRLVACSNEAAEYVELVQIAAAAGPAIDSFASGEAVSVPDIEESAETWPDFSRVSLERGFRRILATPMRWGGRVIGVLTLLCEEPGAVSDRDAALAQALADVATVVILQERIARDSKLIEEQLTRALDSRVVIEQAKGIIAGSQGVSLDEAFALMRTFARHGNLTVRSVATRVSEEDLKPDALVAAVRDLSRIGA